MPSLYLGCFKIGLLGKSHKLSKPSFPGKNSGQAKSRQNQVELRLEGNTSNFKHAYVYVHEFVYLFAYAEMPQCTVMGSFRVFVNMINQ